MEALLKLADLGIISLRSQNAHLKEELALERAKVARISQELVELRASFTSKDLDWQKWRLECLGAVRKAERELECVSCS